MDDDGGSGIESEDQCSGSVDTSAGNIRGTVSLSRI
jgi:hypothetical protein